MNSETLRTLNWWRVTRYDPAMRDERGAYQGETWTSISDVGSSFDGEVLTMEEFVRVEDAYVSAVVSFARESGVEFLEVCNPGDRSRISEGERVSIEAARDVLRKLLREEMWCRLESPNDDFAVHAGYDLYMYIGSDSLCEDAIRLTRASGLFVDEDFLSPWIPEEDEDDN